MGESTAFDVQVEAGGDETTVSVSGELDAYTAPQLRKILDEIIDGSVASVVVDLRSTSFIDSTGLGVLVGAARKARSHDGELIVDSPAHSVHRVLQITGLTLSIPVRNAPAEAEISEVDPKDLTPA
ncbi:MAG TPA: STAS domain-containing protein [Acidimicrobiales bacterium]|nr:STAS domain-containing protein [Acidimicrobiales bacterium]